MDNLHLNRYRLDFAKTSAMRFTGHLDLHRTLERTVRRAGLPIAHTQGFNPRQRLSIGVPLPLGFTSDCEVVDLWLEGSMDPAELLSALQHAAPPGIRFISAREIDRSAPKIQSRIEAASYQVSLDTDSPVADLGERVRLALAENELQLRRRGKPYNLRPLILELETIDEHTLQMKLTASQQASGRPDEVLTALGIEPTHARIHRSAMHISA